MKDWMSHKQYSHLIVGLIAVDLFMVERLKKGLTEKEVLETIGDPESCPNGRSLLTVFYKKYFIPILPYWEKAWKTHDEYKREKREALAATPSPVKMLSQKKKKGDVDVEQLFS
jgi:hypothetical protein